MAWLQAGLQSCDNQACAEAAALSATGMIAFDRRCRKASLCCLKIPGMRKRSTKAQVQTIMSRITPIPMNEVIIPRTHNTSIALAEPVLPM